VDSRPGSGTTFSAYLPLAEGQPAQEPAPVAVAGGNGESILVVDDEESLGHLAEEVLASLGYEPVGALGALEALRVFRAAPERFGAVASGMIRAEKARSDRVRALR